MNWKSALIGTVLAVPVCAYFVASCEYLDRPLAASTVGRTKNSISAIVMGLVSQKLYENSTSEIEVEKELWPDAIVKTRTTPGEIDSRIDLLFTESHFTAQRNQKGKLKGYVDKTGINWDVYQIGPNTYVMKHFETLVVGTLNVEAQNGIILGEYQRNWPANDWEIIGKYDDDGTIKVTIDGPVNLGVVLSGKITEKKRQ